jgi:hypothetical protein
MSTHRHHRRGREAATPRIIVHTLNSHRAAFRYDASGARLSGDGEMPAEKYVATRTDGVSVGKTIREIVRLMIEDGMTWQNAADAVGLKRQRAYRALHKPHVLAYRREERKKFIELLSTRVPVKLSNLMDSENAAAAVRAALALEDMNNQSQALPSRRIQTGGIVIMLGAATSRALSPDAAAMPALELERVDE